MRTAVLASCLETARLKAWKMRDLNLLYMRKEEDWKGARTDLIRLSIILKILVQLRHESSGFRCRNEFQQRTVELVNPKRRPSILRFRMHFQSLIAALRLFKLYRFKHVRKKDQKAGREQAV